MTYAERQLLGLHRTGAIDVDKEGRERTRRDRYNAKRIVKRAKRGIERATEKEKTAKSGVNRCIPSSRRVVLDSDSLEIRERIPENRVKTPRISKIGCEKPDSRRRGPKCARNLCRLPRGGRANDAALRAGSCGSRGRGDEMAKLGPCTHLPLKVDMFSLNIDVR
jgi:hypothetical protein